MADKTIGSLPEATELDENSLLVTEQLVKARRVTGELLAAYAKEAAQKEAERASGYAQKSEDSARNAKEAAETAWKAVQGFFGVIDPVSGQLTTVQVSLDNIYNFFVATLLSPITAEGYDTLELTAETYDTKELSVRDYDTMANSILGGN